MIKSYMTKTYIVHSHELNEFWNPKQEYKSRLDKLVLLLKNDFNDRVNIILTWGKATKWVDFRHCDAWFEYLTNLWIEKELIFREKDVHWSIETVWEWIFAIRDYFELINNSNIINLISSDYHKKRILEIQKFILWKQLSSKLTFSWVDKIIHGNLTRTIEQEENSLNAFLNTFKWINSWDINSIENRLWKDHPLYKNHPSNPYNI